MNHWFYASGEDHADNDAKWNMATEAVLRMSKQDVRTSTGGVFVGATNKTLGQGAIVNVSSGAGIRGQPALAAYCASKHGVNGVTKAMAKDWPGIRMNVVAPGKYRVPWSRKLVKADKKG